MKQNNLLSCDSHVILITTYWKNPSLVSMLSTNNSLEGAFGILRKSRNWIDSYF